MWLLLPWARAEPVAAPAVHRVIGGWQCRVVVWGGEQIIAGQVMQSAAEAEDDAFREMHYHYLTSVVEMQASLAESHLPQSGDQ